MGLGITDAQIMGKLGRIADEAATLRQAEEYAANISADERKKLAAKGHALSDGSYPIRNEADLRNAESLAKSGHGNVAAATALIKRRAKALGVEHKMGGKEKAAADAHDVAVQRAIEDAIRLQESDPDNDPADKQVMSLLKQALAAQRGDTG